MTEWRPSTASRAARPGQCRASPTEGTREEGLLTAPKEGLCSSQELTTSRLFMETQKSPAPNKVECLGTLRSLNTRLFEREASRAAACSSDC